MNEKAFNLVNDAKEVCSLRKSVGMGCKGCFYVERSECKKNGGLSSNELSMIEMESNRLKANDRDTKNREHYEEYFTVVLNSNKKF